MRNDDKRGNKSNYPEIEIWNISHPAMFLCAKKISFNLPTFSNDIDFF